MSDLKPCPFCNKRQEVIETKSEAIRDFCKRAGILPSVQVRGLPDDVKAFRAEAAFSERGYATALTPETEDATGLKEYLRTKVQGLTEQYLGLRSMDLYVEGGPLKAKIEAYSDVLGQLEIREARWVFPTPETET